MFKFMFLLSLLAFVLGNYEDALTAIYKYTDSNQDGVLTDGEIILFFQDLDTNKDSIISKEEFLWCMPELPEIKGYEEDLFKFYDRNGDGSLTLEGISDVIYYYAPISLDEFLGGATGSS